MTTQHQPTVVQFGKDRYQIIRCKWDAERHIGLVYVERERDAQCFEIESYSLSPVDIRHSVVSFALSAHR